MADLPTTESSEVTVADSAGIYKLTVNSDGSINVNPLSTPPTPINATDVIVSAFSSVASTAGIDTYYTITSGKILTVTTFLAGAEADNSGSVAEIFYDPNGNLTNMIRISTLFLNGDSDNTPVSQDFTGNGTRRLVLRRRGYTANGREMFSQWIGYEV